MIVDHENKVLIATPPKTGCTSLEFSIRYRDDVPDGIAIVRWLGAGKKPHTMLVPDFAEGYTRYMTVRHPLDRLVSLYYHHTKEWQKGKEWRDGRDFFATDPSFNEFVKWYLAQRKWNRLAGNAALPPEAQHLSWWLPPNIWMVTLGQCYDFFKPDKLIRLETYEADLAAINPYWSKVPHRMSAGTDTSWQKHFNKTTLRLVLNDHADYDLELLGYDIDWDAT